MNDHLHHHGHAAGEQAQAGTIYTCPMHPEVQQDHPGNCPICHMNLVPEGQPVSGHDHHGHATGEQAPASAAQPPQEAPAGTTYTCPMHPEIRQDHPGNCPICGMTLESVIPLDEEDNSELIDFQRRFWWTLPLTVVVTILAMFGHRLGWFDMRTQTWVELVLSLPVVLWAGVPFFTRCWQSIINRSPNMWTLIGLGTGAAFAERELGEAEIKFYPDPAAAFAGLRQDQIDLYIHDAPTSWQLATTRDNADLISLYSPMTEEMLAWAVRPDDLSLAGELNRALLTMKGNGTLQYILNRWIPVRVEVH